MLTDLDYELLSTYLDGALTQTERAALELRLLAEPELSHELGEVRATITLLNNLPLLKAPRDFTLDTRYARRSSFFFTSTTFSALSTAAAIVLFAVGAYLFTGNNTSPPAVLFGQVAQSPLQPSSTDDNLDKTAADTPTESDLLNELQATGGDTTTGDAGLAGSSGLAQESANVEPAQAPIIELFLAASAQPTGMPLDGFFADRVPTATGATDDNQRTSEATQASANQQHDTVPNTSSSDTNPAPPAPLEEIQTEANAALAFATTQPPPLTVTAVPTVTVLPTATLAPTTTYTRQPTATPILFPTEPPSPAAPLASPAPDLLPLLLLGMGSVLLIVAIVTTIIRRRNRS